MGDRKPRQQRSRDTRDRILAAALELLAERGMAGISQRAIAERAGVSLSATTYYFGTGADLERIAIETHYARRVEDYRQVAGVIADVETTPEVLIDGVAELLASSPDLVLAHFEVYLNAARRDDLREILVPVWAEMVALVELAARSLGVDEPAEFARGAIAVIEGIQLRRVAEGIDGRAEMAGALRALLVGALAQQEAPEVWAGRLGRANVD